MDNEQTFGKWNYGSGDVDIQENRLYFMESKASTYIGRLKAGNDKRAVDRYNKWTREIIEWQ